MGKRKRHETLVKKDDNEVLTQSSTEINKEGNICIPMVFLGIPLIFFWKYPWYIFSAVVVLISYITLLLYSKKIYNISTYLHNSAKAAVFTLMFYLDAITLLFTLTVLDEKAKIMILGCAIKIQIVTYIVIILIMCRPLKEKKHMEKGNIYLASSMGAIVGIYGLGKNLKGISQEKAYVAMTAGLFFIMYVFSMAVPYNLVLYFREKKKKVGI